jgi:hypothetical protein
MASADVIKRITWLLRIAARTSDTPEGQNEIRNAAAMARELMDKHGIEVDLDAPLESEPSAEGWITAGEYPSRDLWREILAWKLAQVYEIHYDWRPIVINGAVELGFCDPLGHEAHTRAAIETFHGFEHLVMREPIRVSPMLAMRFRMDDVVGIYRAGLVNGYAMSLRDTKVRRPDHIALPPVDDSVDASDCTSLVYLTRIRVPANDDTATVVEVEVAHEVPEDNRPEAIIYRQGTMVGVNAWLPPLVRSDSA